MNSPITKRTGSRPTYYLISNCEVLGGQSIAVILRQRGYPAARAAMKRAGLSNTVPVYDTQEIAGLVETCASPTEIRKVNDAKVAFPAASLRKYVDSEWQDIAKVLRDYGNGLPGVPPEIAKGKSEAGGGILTGEIGENPSPSPAATTAQFSAQSSAQSNLFAKDGIQCERS